MGFQLVPIHELKEHEEIIPEHLRELREEIVSDGVLIRPIAVTREHLIVLDGHHRLNILKELGCARIPAFLVDYRSPDVVVASWREGVTITKEMVVEAALSGRVFPPKTTKHLVRVDGQLKHITVIEKPSYIPLDELR
jgi:hypothetical protein